MCRLPVGWLTIDCALLSSDIFTHHIQTRLSFAICIHPIRTCATHIPPIIPHSHCILRIHAAPLVAVLWFPLELEHPGFRDLGPAMRAGWIPGMCVSAIVVRCMRLLGASRADCLTPSRLPSLAPQPGITLANSTLRS